VLSSLNSSAPAFHPLVPVLPLSTRLKRVLQFPVFSSSEDTKALLSYRFLVFSLINLRDEVVEDQPFLPYPKYFVVTF